MACGNVWYNRATVRFERIDISFIRHSILVLIDKIIFIIIGYKYAKY